MAEIIVLRLVHVLGGIFWVGTAVFTALFLMPALADAGPAAGAVGAGLQRRRLMVVMPVIALLTILSGARLMWMTSGGLASEYLATGRGLTFAIGAVAALLAFLLGIFVGRPLGMRMAALGGALQAASDDATRGRLAGEMAALQPRSRAVNAANVVLLLTAAIAMAIGRYVP